MARYTYPADELETLHGKAGLNKIAKRMGELFERMGWVSSPDDVQWELVTWGVFDLKFEHPGDPDDDPGVVIYMAPDWDGEFVGVSVSAVDEDGGEEHYGFVELSWTGDVDRDAALIVGAVTALITTGDRDTRPGRGGSVPQAESLRDMEWDAIGFREGYSELNELTYDVTGKTFDYDRFELEATQALGTGERVYYDHPGILNFWVGNTNVLATPDWDLGGVSVQLDIYADTEHGKGDIVSSDGVGGAIFLPWTGDYATDAALWVGAVVATIQQEGLAVYTPDRGSPRPLLGIGG